MFVPFLLLAAAVGVTRFLSDWLRLTTVGVLVLGGLLGGYRNVTSERTQLGAEVVPALNERAHDRGMSSSTAPISSVLRAPAICAPISSRSRTRRSARPSASTGWTTRSATRLPIPTPSRKRCSRAGDHTVWLAWAGTYRTFEGQCEELNTAFLRARPTGQATRDRQRQRVLRATRGCSSSRRPRDGGQSGSRDPADLRAAFPAWVAARVLVAVAYGIARLWREHAHPGELTIQLHQGLFAGRRVLPRHRDSRYDALPEAALRFFPLYPLFGRGLGWMLGGNEGLALLLIANVSTLAAGALMHRLVLVDLADRRTAQLSASLLALAPPAFVLVWAYAEALYLVCAIGMLLALRRRSWWWATASAGLLAGLARPFGVVLAVPARDRGPEGIAAYVAAGSCRAARRRSWRPIVGLGAFLLWIGSLDPIHQQGQLRGEWIDPFRGLGRAIGDMFGSQRFLDGLHLAVRDRARHPRGAVHPLAAAVLHRVHRDRGAQRALGDEPELTRAVWAQRVPVVIVMAMLARAGASSGRRSSCRAA